MKIKTKVVSVALSLAIAGCASKIVMLDKVVDLNQSYRIIKHDFNVKYEIVPDVPKAKESIEISTKAESKKVEITGNLKTIENPPLSYVDVEFYNESSAIVNSKETVSTILNELDAETYLIVGHSHGQSNVGVDRLAVQRAQYMSDILQSAGVPKGNIFYISSWSDGTQNYSISKGVRVFALPDTLSKNQSLITGIITKRG